MTVARRRRIPLTLVLAFALVATLLATGADPADAASREPNQPASPNWEECYQDIGADFGVTYECAAVRVPLDYDDPGGTKIAIALVRLPATDVENRIGSLFLNPGGPGGSGVDFALFFGPFAQFVWGPVANQYDIVGFDPRGIARSTPLRCFANLDEAVLAFPPLPFPMVEEEVALFEASDNYLNDSCRADGTKVLRHMSTANVVHDLDLLRNMVGDEKLNFVGLSYGTYVGQTYANLYPDNVGAVVIDGVLDPIAWANLDAEVPFSTALKSDVGAQATLDEFLDQCESAGAGNCAFAPDAAARLDALLERLQEGPILITDPVTGETFPYIYSFLVGDLLGPLYNPFGFSEAAEFLAFLESQAAAEVLGEARQAMEEATGLSSEPTARLAHRDRNYPNFVEGFPAVACEDTTNPDGGHAGWFEVGKLATAQNGIFGELWTWASSPCTVWSSFDDDAYKGPYDTSTANPVLVIGNLYDPATRYEGALTANGLLADSALITVDEPGHTSLGISGCAGFLTGLYLSDPANGSSLDGAFCPSEGNWFDKAAAAQAGNGLGKLFRTALMEDIAFRP